MDLMSTVFVFGACNQIRCWCSNAVLVATVIFMGGGEGGRGWKGAKDITGFIHFLI